MKSHIEKDWTLDLEVEYSIVDAEPDVGIHHPGVEDVVILHPKTGKPVSQDVYDVLGEKFMEQLSEQLIEEIEL